MLRAKQPVKSVLNRALGPARHDASPLSHFGLAAAMYVHFTLPLRRHADLMVHRIIRAYLSGTRDSSLQHQDLPALAQHINQRATAAARAETARLRMLGAESVQTGATPATPPWWPRTEGAWRWAWPWM